MLRIPNMKKKKKKYKKGLQCCEHGFALLKKYSCNTMAYKLPDRYYKFACVCCFAHSYPGNQKGLQLNASAEPHPKKSKAC